MTWAIVMGSRSEVNITLSNISKTFVSAASKTEIEAVSGVNLEIFNNEDRINPGLFEPLLSLAAKYVSNGSMITSLKL